MDLIKLLPQKDKDLMAEYIYRYGVGKKDFIGLDEYLKYWAESKKKLYKMLGNQFQVEFPFSYEKPVNELYCSFFQLINTLFADEFRTFLREMAEKDKVKIITKESLDNMWYWMNIDTFLDDKVPKPVKFIGENGKEVRIQVGMKPMRALQKAVNAFPSFFKKEHFEEFRIKHSLCLNDRVVKGKLVISIHPFDFITMSDNNSDWHSCMSWTEKGCYRVGSVEMMNSNNVVIAYIESKTPYNFDRGDNKDESLQWNNKKWRQLFYVTKDIIVSGKPYPYTNKDFTISVLNKLKDLAKDNLSWEYNYGPEEYLDMKRINYLEDMEENRALLLNRVSKKHNILFNSHGMYNDMLNDNNTTYYCYRNKVPRMRIISYSGKAPCACCGNPSILNESDYIEDYNDRYDNSENVVCNSCYYEGECDRCEGFVGKSSLIHVKNYYSTKEKICLKCAQSLYRICPCCGEAFLLSHKDFIPGIRITQDEIYYTDYEFFKYRYYEGELKVAETDSIVTPYQKMKVVPAFICRECIKKDLKKIMGGLFKEETLRRNPSEIWMPDRKDRIISKKVYTEEEILKHPILSQTIYANLRMPSIE